MANNPLVKSIREPDPESRAFQNWPTTSQPISLSHDSNNRQKRRRCQKLSAGETAYADLEGARNFSHSLILNNAIAQGGMRAFRQGVIGTGIRMRAETKLPSGEPDQELNELIEQQWSLWGEHASVCGQMTWLELTRHVLTCLIESGEVFVRIIYKPAVPGGLPLSFQILESDMIEDTYMGGFDAAQWEYWKHGIKFDRYGAPLAYAFLTDITSPLGHTDRVQYPASDIIHLFMRDEGRPGAVRGWPWFVPCLHTLDQNDSFSKAVLAYAEANAISTAYISPGLNTNVEPRSYSELEQLDLTGSGQVVLGVGDQVYQNNATSNSQIDQFTYACQRAVATSMGISYEELTHDHSRSNFSSSRQANITAQARYGEVGTFLINRFYRPIYGRWSNVLEMVAEDMEIDLPADFSERKCDVSFSMPKRPYVEPVKQWAANKAAHDMGAVSLSTIAADAGYDLASELRKRRQDEDLMEELGIELVPAQETRQSEGEQNASSQPPGGDQEESNNGQ